MNRAQFEDMLASQRKTMQFYEQYPRGCKGCIKFRGVDQVCERYGQPVPPDFQGAGCDEWNFDDCPF